MINIFAFLDCTLCIKCVRNPLLSVINCIQYPCQIYFKFNNIDNYLKFLEYFIQFRVDSEFQQVRKLKAAVTSSNFWTFKPVGLIYFFKCLLSPGGVISLLWFSVLAIDYVFWFFKIICSYCCNIYIYKLFFWQFSSVKDWPQFLVTWLYDSILF